MGKSPIQWTSPVELYHPEGVALAICVRLVGTSEEKADGTVKFRTASDRDFKSLIPTTLTADMIEHLVKQFAYVRFCIRTPPFATTEAKVLKMIKRLNEEDAEKWYATHPEYIAEVEAELRELVAGKGSLGFRCVG